MYPQGTSFATTSCQSTSLRPPLTWLAALFSIFHLPREEHSDLFRKIYRWLVPGGHLLCTLSHRSEQGYTEGDFFGVTMYWSNYSLEEYRKMLAEIGFTLLATSTTGSGYQDAAYAINEDHPLVLAQKH